MGPPQLQFRTATASKRAAALQLSPSIAYKNSFLFNLGNKYLVCDRIEGHEIIAAVCRLELRFCSRPSQKKAAPQPQKWVRFRGPKTGPQTPAYEVSWELMLKRRSFNILRFVSEIRSFWRPHFWGRQHSTFWQKIRRRDRLKLPSNNLQPWAFFSSPRQSRWKGQSF